MRRKAIFIILLAFVIGIGMVVTDNLQAAEKVIKWRVQSHWPAASSSSVSSWKL